MNWSTIETTLASEVSRVLGGEVVTAWEHSAAAAGWAPTQFVELALISLRKVGRDETRTTPGADGISLDLRTWGNRVLTVQVKIDSMQAGMLASSGMAYADSLISALDACPDMYETLRDVAGIAVSEIKTLRTMDYCDCDGVARSAALFEVAFNTTSRMDCSSIPFVASVRFSGTVAPDPPTQIGPLTLALE